MSTDDKILPDKEVEFRLQIPSRPEAIVIRGAVIRTYRCGSESWYNCAVKFSNSQEDSIKLLLGFMDQLKKTSH